MTNRTCTTTCTSTLLHGAVDWTNGDIVPDTSEEYTLFDELIRSGLAWQIGGPVAERARELIASGACCVPTAGIKP